MLRENTFCLDKIGGEWLSCCLQATCGGTFAYHHQLSVWKLASVLPVEEYTWQHLHILLPILSMIAADSGWVSGWFESKCESDAVALYWIFFFQISPKTKGVDYEEQQVWSLSSDCRGRNAFKTCSFMQLFKERWELNINKLIIWNGWEICHIVR